MRIFAYQRVIDLILHVCHRAAFLTHNMIMLTNCEVIAVIGIDQLQALYSASSAASASMRYTVARLIDGDFSATASQIIISCEMQNCK